MTGPEDPERPEAPASSERPSDHRAPDADHREAPGRKTEDIRPEPGLTAPLDDLRDEERDIEPGGVLPGAGPDDARDTADARTADAGSGGGDQETSPDQGA